MHGIAECLGDLGSARPESWEQSTDWTVLANQKRANAGESNRQNVKSSQKKEKKALCTKIANFEDEFIVDLVNQNVIELKIYVI